MIIIHNGFDRELMKLLDLGRNIDYTLPSVWDNAASAGRDVDH
jgi:hypothetical protein